MIDEVCRGLWSLSAVYWYRSEQRTVKIEDEEDETQGSILFSLKVAHNYLSKVEKAGAIASELETWLKKLDTKYPIGEKIDDKDKNALDEWLVNARQKLFDLAASLDKEQKSISSVETTVRNLENKFESIRSEVGQIGSLREYISRIQSATFGFVESTPTVRSFDTKLRGLINTASAELFLAGYFDQALLTDFSKLSSKPKIKIISPELTNSRQDQINLDALKRLNKLGAEVKFHPMLHARVALSQSELIVGSADFKSDCLGGRRYDAGIWSNSNILIESCRTFVDTVWNEAKPL